MKSNKKLLKTAAAIGGIGAVAGFLGLASSVKFEQNTNNLPIGYDKNTKHLEIIRPPHQSSGLGKWFENMSKVALEDPSSTAFRAKVAMALESMKDVSNNDKPVWAHKAQFHGLVKEIMSTPTRKSIVLDIIKNRKYRGFSLYKRQVAQLSQMLVVPHRDVQAYVYLKLLNMQKVLLENCFATQIVSIAGSGYFYIPYEWIVTITKLRKAVRRTMWTRSILADEANADLFQKMPEHIFKIFSLFDILVLDKKAFVMTRDRFVSIQAQRMRLYM